MAAGRHAGDATTVRSGTPRGHRAGATCSGGCRLKPADFRALSTLGVLPGRSRGGSFGRSRLWSRRDRAVRVVRAAPRRSPPRRSLPAWAGHRSRRDGHHPPCDGRSPRARGRGQDPAARGRVGSRPCPPVSARGARGDCAPPPEHRRLPRYRHGRRAGLPRHGPRRRGGPGGPAPAERAAGGMADGTDRARHRPRPGRRAHPRDRPPGRQARQHPARGRWEGDGHRLRHRSAGGRRGGGAARHDARVGPLLQPRAGARNDDDPGLRRLRPRPGHVRGADRHARLDRRDDRRHRPRARRSSRTVAQGPPPRDPRGARGRRSPRACARAWRPISERGRDGRRPRADRAGWRRVEPDERRVDPRPPTP